MIMSSIPLRVITLIKPKRIQKALTIEEKLKIIKEVEKKEKTKTEIAQDFDIPTSTLSTILKNKDKIFNDSKFISKKRKRNRGVLIPDVEDCLIKWINKAKKNNWKINGPIIKTKAELFAREFGEENFKASTGWLESFKQRNDITFNKNTKNKDKDETFATGPLITTSIAQYYTTQLKRFLDDQMEKSPNNKDNQDIVKSMQSIMAYVNNKVKSKIKQKQSKTSNDSSNISNNDFPNYNNNNNNPNNNYNNYNNNPDQNDNNCNVHSTLQPLLTSFRPVTHIDANNQPRLNNPYWNV